MKMNILLSDLLKNRSEIYENTHYKLLKAETCKIASKAKSIRTFHFERFSDQALQKVWQAKMQMCQRNRSRTKVLFISQHIWFQACRDLYSTCLQRSGRKGFESLSRFSSDYGRYHHNQSRAHYSGKEIITSINDTANESISLERNRFVRSHCYHSKYDRKVFRK